MKDGRAHGQEERGEREVKRLESGRGKGGGHLPERKTPEMMIQCPVDIVYLGVIEHLGGAGPSRAATKIPGQPPNCPSADL